MEKFKSPKPPKSPKSPKYTTPTATYIITAHGTMLTSMLGTPQTKKYHAINIPENVELYTMVNLGNCIPDDSTQADFICKLEKETQKARFKLSLSPAFKFTHEHGKTNKFPELLLTPDKTTPVTGYKGITHCIPEDYRTSASRGHEIIYNIDAKNTKNCICSSIVSKSTTKPYDCIKNYSDYYKEQLKYYKYDPTSTSINKCGPILMNEAVQIIQAHCNSCYEPICVIQIYVFACLGEIDLKIALDFTELKKYADTNGIAFPPSPNSNIGLEVSESESNLMNYYYELIKHNTLGKVSVTNVVESLTDFNAIPLISSLLSKYLVMYRNKIFEITTYNGAYIEVASDLYNEFTGTHEEIIEQLERRYRSHDRNKLNTCFTEALNKLFSDESDNSITILPNFNKINLVIPSITRISGNVLSNIIYDQLKELIKKQKPAQGGRRRKKTLRKRRKIPYVKKKSTTKILLSTNYK